MPQNIIKPEEGFETEGVYLSNTFSLKMLAKGMSAEIQECGLSDIPNSTISIIRNRNIASIVSTIMGKRIPNRNLTVTLYDGDKLYCVVPNVILPPDTTYSRSEIKKAGWRVYGITVYSGSNFSCNLRWVTLPTQN